MKGLAGRGCDEGADGGGGLSTVVAKQRFWGMRDGRASKIAEETRRRVGGLRAAIAKRSGRGVGG